MTISTPYRDLLAAIVKSVRTRAKLVPCFRESGNGCIRILAIPGCPEADQWLGGSSTFDAVPNFPDDVAEYEHSFAITPGGNRTIETRNNECPSATYRCSCYGYSALKIAHLMETMRQHKGLTSGEPKVELDIPSSDLPEEWGYAPQKGACCITLYEATKPERDKFFCRFFISVSGADPSDDEFVALAGLTPIIECANTAASDVLFRSMPNILYGLAEDREQSIRDALDDEKQRQKQSPAK